MAGATPEKASDEDERASMLRSGARRTDPSASGGARESRATAARGLGAAGGSGTHIRKGDDNKIRRLTVSWGSEAKLVVMMVVVAVVVAAQDRLYGCVSI